MKLLVNVAGLAEVAGAIGNGPLGALGHSVDMTKIRSKALQEVENKTSDVPAEVGEWTCSRQPTEKPLKLKFKRSLEVTKEDREESEPKEKVEKSTVEDWEEFEPKEKAVKSTAEDRKEFQPKKTENLTAEEVATVMATCIKSGLEGCGVMFDIFLNSKVWMLGQ